MSVRKMAEVWERSNHSGSALLMLLAIADFADDDGRAYPSVSTLAAKCRMKPRNANVILAALRESAELVIRIGEGPHGTNLYHILPLQSLAPLQTIAPLQSNASPPAKDCSKPLQRNAPKPSLNHHEPSSTANYRSPIGSKSGKLTCPVEAIVDLYHECMPRNPRVKVLNDGRRKAISLRWADAAVLTCKPFGYASVEDGLAAWRAYFETCSESLFLTGRVIPRSGERQFLADIDFLVSPKGFASCLENKYHREAA